MPKTRILVVDDDSELREAVTEQLSMHEEFEVTAVGSGREAVQAAQRNAAVEIRTNPR
jgi:CheY-like chemotaxis protein